MPNTATEIEHIQRKTGPELLAQHLRDQILAGVYPIGTALAPERELADMSGLSRPTVRAGLRILETEGLIETRQGRNGGAFVRSLDAKDLQKTLNLFIRGLPVNVLDFIETRKILQTAAAGLAAARGGPDDIAAIEEATLALEAQSPDDTVNVLTAAMNWEVAMTRAAGNEMLVGVIGAFSKRHTPSEGDRAIMRKMDPHAGKAVIAAYRRVFDAIKSGDADTAEHRMKRHFEAYAALMRKHVEGAWDQAEGD